MTIAERIKKYLELNPKVDQAKTPSVGIYWHNKNGFNIYSSITKKTKTPEHYANATRLSWQLTKTLINDYRVNLLSSPRNIQAAYINYDEETGVCEFSMIHMNAKRFKDGECGIWEWDDNNHRYFCVDKENIIYTADGNMADCISYNSNRYTPKIYLTSVIHKYVHHHNPSVICPALEEFKKFVGDITYKRNGGAFASNTLPALYTWASKKITRTKPTPQQKLINTLTSIELSADPDINEIDTNKKMQNYYWACSGYVKFEKINEKWSTLRIYNIVMEDSLSECARVYISNDKTILTSKNEFGEWEKCTNIGRYNNYSFINYEEIINCDRLKYIKTILDAINKDKRVQAINNIIRHPILEQLAKIGFTNLIINNFTSSAPLADTKNIFGDINEKGSNLYTILGINKYQLQLLKNNEEMRNARYAAIPNQQDKRDWTVQRERERLRQEIDIALYPKNIIAAIKDLHNCKSINHLDENTTLLSVNIVKWICRSLGYSTAKISSHFSEIPNRWKFMKKMYELSDNGDTLTTIQTVRDILSMNRRIAWLNNNQPININWENIDSLEELNTIHDNAQALGHELHRQYNLAHPYRPFGKQGVCESDEKKYDETIEERKYLEYEDDDYAIILPHKLIDLINEGNNLSHCVGGYIQRHASGNTTILFLRKKSDMTKSWVTIETNNNRIVQMHGRFNCWMGYSDETFNAVPFVMKWLEKNKIKCDERILTCKSSSYGMGCSFRSQSELKNLINKSNI